ncbi:hypothetical protein [Ruminococcus sp. FC2018]|uniref:hypothetical protein n=1 Tax=Ruminococcus sp. FC2018 TaxID=1410617 RepID=UPI00048E5CFF|nr:hypothetical protein [Ruminococcus sp. FC2018]
MKKPYKVILLLGLLSVLFLTACHMSKDAVSLKNESSLKKYAKENCPDCTFVRYEKEQYKHTAYFTDDKCGFEFPVSSEVTTVHFDGSKAGYEEKTVNGWGFAYYNYVLDCVQDGADKICKEYAMTYEREKYMPQRVLIRLKSDKPYEELKDGLTKLGELIRKADVCEKFTEFDMRVEPASEKYGTFYAFYRFKDGKTGERELWQAYRFMDFAENQLGVKCIYERTEEMVTRDIPGITKLQNYSEKTGHIKKKVYYFTTENGEKKFIADYYEKYKTYYIGDVG